jgi:XTP/dITP diphosphohydrolase
VRIYLATSNHGKLRDFQALAAGSDITLELLPADALQPAPEETGATFAENAAIKAVEYSRRVPGEFVLADDSGLAVDALNGAPGVHSARYASATDGNAADAANNERLLRELADVPPERRTGRFLCALALAQDGTVTRTAEGAVDGRILRALRGSGGFGYDPLFLVPELGLTFAEIPPDHKGEFSHRGRAFRALLDQLS